MTTHYVPPFTVHCGGSTERAICGRPAQMFTSTTQPTCEDCQKLLRDGIPERECVNCLQTRPGRFGRHKYASGNNWQRGFTHFVWYCWDCKPFGDMQHEAKELEAERASA